MMSQYQSTPTLAAVVVPIMVRQSGYAVLLTQRSATVTYHSNQICLPGGRFDTQQDTNLVQTALREFEEETGLPAHRVEVLGHLSAQISSTNFHIHPLYGLIHPPYAFHMNEDEVTKFIEVPLDFLIEQDNFTHAKYHTKLKAKSPVHRYCVEYENSLIWGVTATILREFRKIDIKNKLADMVIH